MEKIVHGHDILDYLRKNSPVSKENLKIELENKYGKDIRFTNCTKNIYTFDEILYFFINKNKIKQIGGMISINNNDCSCSH